MLCFFTGENWNPHLKTFKQKSCSLFKWNAILYNQIAQSTHSAVQDSFMRNVIRFCTQPEEALATSTFSLLCVCSYSASSQLHQFVLPQIQLAYQICVVMILVFGNKSYLVNLISGNAVNEWYQQPPTACRGWIFAVDVIVLCITGSLTDLDANKCKPECINQ